MHVSVVTPDASFYDGEASGVSLPGADGELGVLSGHAPMIARLGHGVARVRMGSETQRIAIFGGFLKVQDNVVTILAGGAQSPEGSPDEARTRYEEARQALAAAKASKQGLSEAEEALRRARAVHKLMSGS